MAGILGLPYTAALLESALHYSDTSLFHNFVATQVAAPWWNEPAISTAGIVILLLHVASLALLFRAPILQNEQRSSASGWKIVGFLNPRVDVVRKGRGR
jgi:hypothetical protein